MPRAIAAVVTSVLLLLVGAQPTWAAAAPSAPGGVFVLSGEDNRLNVYDAATGQKATVIPSASDNPTSGLDINAEICIVPDGVPWKPAGQIWFIAGEDTDQNSVPGVIRQGWGIFRLTGSSLATLAAQEMGKLVPDSFVTETDNPENYGCGVLPDGRIVTTDVGDQLPTSPATGQLISWFPKASLFQGHLPSGRTDFPRVPHCKIDVGIGTAGGMEVNGTNVFVASNRPNQQTGEPGGIYKYAAQIWPKNGTAAGGCGRQDGTGEPLANTTRVGKELFIPQSPALATPSDIVNSGRGTFFVSSVFSGQVAEYTKQGVLKRYVLTSSGQANGITPYGIDVTPDGTLWIADLGIVGPGPAQDAGSVARVRFTGPGDVPLPPETIDENLQFPDGIGVVVIP